MDVVEVSQLKLAIDPEKIIYFTFFPLQVLQVYLICTCARSVILETV